MTTLPDLSKSIRPLAIATVLACTVAGGLVGLALAQEGEGEEGEASDATAVEATPPAEVIACSECHPDVVAAWENGPHALAYADPIFQAGWEAQDFDTACLECHTTGFSRSTGDYSAEGVTCDACHGSTPEGHPPEPVDLNRTSQVCADCHLVTQAEFRASAHRAEEMVCTSCHYAHNNGLRLATEVEQCLDCHDHQLDDYAHASHIQADLTCRSCHGYVEPGQEVPPDGLAPTGHDFQENVTACLDCHQDIELVAVDDGGEDGEGFTSTGTHELVTGGQQAALRAAQLEAVLETVLLQRRNCLALRLVQGGVGGLFIGGLGVWFYTRRKNGNAGSGPANPLRKLFGRRKDGDS